MFWHQILPNARKNRCSAVNPSIFGWGFAFERIHERHKREPQAAIVGRVLAERQFSIDVNIVDRLERRVLLNETLGAFFELLGVLRGPPVLQIAFWIELPALIVETVRQLVADDGSDGAVVHRRVHALVIERRLEDAGGEIDIVLRRM